MRLAYLELAVLGSLDRHDMYMYMTRPIWQVKKNLRRI